MSSTPLDQPEDAALQSAIADICNRQYDKQITIAETVQQLVSLFAGHKAQAVQAAVGKIYVNLPIMDDLDTPLQQSWKLGGTDIESYKRGYSDAATKAFQAVQATQPPAADTTKQGEGE